MMLPASTLRIFLKRGATALVAAALVSGCKTPGASSTLASQKSKAAAPKGTESGLKMCAAVRGNGDLIFGHFSSLARLIEHYGLIDGYAGGSSASISAFLYESMYANPLLRDCDGAACSATETAARASLLLKSLQGYIGVISGTDEVVALQHLGPIVDKIKSSGVGALVAEDRLDAARELAKILRSREVHSLVNPEAIELLETSKAPAFHARSMYDQVVKLGAWSVEDEVVFFRPGLVSFEAVAAKLGRIGSFYAGYEPVDKAAMGAFLSQCATPALGKNWVDAQALPAADGQTCGQAFGRLVIDYRQKLLVNEASFPSRIDEPIGKHLPALISTAVLEGEQAAAIYDAARQRYLNGQPTNFTFDDFSLVKFGYWGRADHLQRVAANPRGYDDLKTKKFLSLGEASWRTALSLSPAEPGLARFLDIPGGPRRISAGGWSDLHPVLVLKNLGCENVVYVSRQWEGETSFAYDLARQLGIDKAEEAALYDLGKSPPSAYERSISEADGVWCTNWNAFTNSQIAAISADAYDAPFEARSPFFKAGSPAYPHAKDRVELPSCTPGIGSTP